MKRFLHTDAGIWAHRDVRLILPARALALAGNAMAVVTLLLQAQGRGAGTIGVAALLICLALPAVALMGVSGRFADTHDSRMLLSVGVGIQVLAFAVLAVSPAFPVTLAGAVLLEVGQSIIAPVWTGLLPRIVGEGSVGSVIAWQQGLGAVATPIGAALGGVLYGAYGATPALLAAAGAFAVLWVAVQAIRTRRHLAAESPATAVTDITATDITATDITDITDITDDADAASAAAATTVAGATNRAASASVRRGAGGMLAGVAVLRRDPVVWPTVLALLPMVVMVEGVNAVEVFLARDTLGATPAQYGLGEIAAGLGGILGAALAGRIAGDRGRVRATIGGFAAACGALAVAGGSPSFWFYLAVMVAVAGAAGVGNASNGALVVTRTPDAQRGTVGAAMSGLARTCSVIALALGGLAGTLASPRAVFVVGGVAGMLAVLILGWRALRSAAAEATPPVAVPAGGVDGW